MFVVGWEDFKKLPTSSIFQEIRGNGGCLGPPMILGEILDYGSGRGDFVEAGLLPEITDAGSLGPDRETIGLGHLGGSERIVIVPSGFGRDGLFDYDRQWLVWEESDRRRLAEWLLDPASAADQQNDDPAACVILDHPPGTA